MNSLIFNKLSELLFIPLNILSYYILLRGHHAPGGGFIAGLICSMSFLMIALSKGTSFARKKLFFDPIIICSWGMAAAFLSVLLSSLIGKEFMVGLWLPLGPLVLGTPQLFDFGVFSVVLGVSQILMLEVLESEG